MDSYIAMGGHTIDAYARALVCAACARACLHSFRWRPRQRSADPNSNPNPNSNPYPIPIRNINLRRSRSWRANPPSLTPSLTPTPSLSLSLALTSGGAGAGELGCLRAARQHERGAAAPKGVGTPKGGPAGADAPGGVLVRSQLHVLRRLLLEPSTQVSVTTSCTAIVRSAPYRPPPDPTACFQL